MRIFLMIGFFALIVLNIGNVEADPCVFCKQEVIDRQSVFQSEYFHVLIDYEPHVKGHLLVIPKRHLEKADQLSKEEWGEFAMVIPKAVEAFSKVLHTDQYVILGKNGPLAFQDVPHFHFHLFPVTTQTWAEIFNIPHRILTEEQIKEEVSLLRPYFVS